MGISNDYEAPLVEVVEVEVEKGFATSSGSTEDYTVESPY